MSVSNPWRNTRQRRDAERARRGYRVDREALRLIALATLHDGRARVVRFPFDPLPVLRALAEGRLPDPALVAAGEFEIEVTPPGEPAEPGGDDAGLRALAAPQVFHR